MSGAIDDQQNAIHCYSSLSESGLVQPCSRSPLKNSCASAPNVFSAGHTKDHYTCEMPLCAAASGAMNLFEILSSELGFRGRAFPDATNQEMQRAVKDFTERLPLEARLVVVFFAGHGREDRLGEQMLLGTDADLAQTTLNVVTVSSVLTTLCHAKIARGATILLILDCCRARSEKAVHNFQQLGVSLQDDRHVAVLYACASGDSVPDRLAEDVKKSPLEVILTTLLRQGHPLSLSGIVTHVQLMLRCMKENHGLVRNLFGFT